MIERTQDSGMLSDQQSEQLGLVGGEILLSLERVATSAARTVSNAGGNALVWAGIGAFGLGILAFDGTKAVVQRADRIRKGAMVKAGDLRTAITDSLVP